MVKFLAGLLEDLTLFVRQSAWLNAVPEVAGKKIDGARPQSRLKTLAAEWAKELAGRDADDYRPSLPPCDAPHLIEYLWDAGPVMDGAMGAAPLSHGELSAWQENTGTGLHAWECRFLRALSREYLAMGQKAESPACPAPYGTAERRIATAKKIDAIFG